MNPPLLFQTNRNTTEFISPIPVIEISGDILRGSKEGDYMFGSAESDLILGKSGHDDLFGFDGDDILNGGHGHDVLEGGAGDDLLIGGKGNDTAIYWGFASEFSLDLSNGTITDLLDDYGTDTLASIEKIGFIDATYLLTDTGVKQIDCGYGWPGWYDSDGLNITGETPEETASYQIKIQHEDQMINMTVHA